MYVFVLMFLFSVGWDKTLLIGLKLTEAHASFVYAHQHIHMGEY